MVTVCPSGSAVLSKFKNMADTARVPFALDVAFDEATRRLPLLEIVKIATDGGRMHAASLSPDERACVGALLSEDSAIPRAQLRLVHLTDDDTDVALADMRVVRGCVPTCVIASVRYECADVDHTSLRATIEQVCCTGAPGALS
jgi:hypothetical protein